ncbi:hypothetical protein HELRODRAFT_63304 [Helobdella robusta]|uniref:Chloride channel protein n=1 Tax=Helobdella robusta TaxID=6412 RepID=T1FXD9_HELRO|nr:hypothetical protein HELRODRAFT_63304 [Helobdella robusta]ESO12802.1 hypothetical protein HELRODRAFT_63304 [Helobdella robusta]
MYKSIVIVYSSKIKYIPGRWISFSYTELGRKVNDSIFLTLLGISVAVISFLIDIVVGRCRQAQISLLSSLDHTMIGQYISWVLFFTVFTCFSVGSTHLIAPTAIGSGIPEVKTMLRGVVMKEYLGLRTLAAKVIGLTTALSSGLPIGKEGSFVHIGVVSAALIAKLLPAFSSSLENHESRLGEILLPGSAVGLSCTFAAPVGALLYSLESTSVNFAIRNYWRSFYASAVGSLMYRLVASWFKEGERMAALRETHLPQGRLFDPSEFIAFSFLGLIAGFLGVLFILMHKYVVLAVRNVAILKRFFTSNRFIYPALVALVVGTFQYPPWLGQYYGGELTNTEALNDLYSNFTWTSPRHHQHRNFDYDVIKQRLLQHWSVASSGGVLMATALFCVMRLWMCSLSTTVPFPCGLIFPAFAIGCSALGRLFGEIMAIIFPAGIRGNKILPGGYAVVGSVAFVGAVTHTFSPVVIALELTGQMGHALPSLLAVMIANAISRNLTSSVYDIILQIKRLPFLPINIQTSSKYLCVSKDIMQRDLKVLTESSSYGEAATLLTYHQFKSFPIVNDRSSMVLLGSIERSILKQVVRDQLCLQNKVEFYSKKLERVMMKNKNGDDDVLLSDEHGDGDGGGTKKRGRNGVGGEDEALMSVSAGNRFDYK